MRLTVWMLGMGVFFNKGWIGQSGLNLGARLQSLGLSCLIVDKNERVGDNWRQRYRVCVRIYCDHLPCSSKEVTN